MVVLVADQNAFNGAAHAMKSIVVLEAGEARMDGWVFFWLWCFGCEMIVGERVEAQRLWLVGIEWERLDGRVGGLKVGWRYGRHDCGEPRDGLRCRVGVSDGWIEVAALKYCFYGLYHCGW